MRTFISLLLIFGSMLVLAAADGISEGQQVFIYDDGLFRDIADATKKELSDDLKNRKIKWTAKSKKNGTLASINETLEKDVLKKKPNLVVLSFGMYDICHPKKMKLNEYNQKAMLAELDKAVRTLKSEEISVVLVTPGLAGENLRDAHQKAIDSFSDALRAYASEQNIKVCDVREKATKWLAAHPPKEAGDLQLSKKGGKWEEEGEALLAPTLMAAIGLRKSGIKRGLRWDERVVMATYTEVFVSSIEKKIEPEMRAAGPQKAPEGFFNPGVKGPDYIHCIHPDLAQEEFDPKIIMRQKPTVLFTYLNSRSCKRLTIPTAPVIPRLEIQMRWMSKQDFPCFAITPMWMNEDNTRELGKKGKRYERCKEVASMVKSAAAKYNVPVIDLFPICEAMHAKDPSVVFVGVYEKNPKHVVMTQAGRDLMRQEVKRALGILKQE